MQGEEPLEPSLLTASDVLQWRRESAGGQEQQVPEAAIITHQGSLVPRGRPWERFSSVRGFSFDLHLTNGGAALAHVRGVGAPATAIAVEELAAAGVRRLIAVDIGAALDASARSGDAILVERGIACDGTSPHYTAGRNVRPDGSLTQRLGEQLAVRAVPFRRGAVWSTDAIYRETGRQLDAARNQGATLADMETACLFAVSAALGIQTAAVLVAADELYDQWRPPSDMRRVREMLQQVFAAARACLQP